MAIMSDTGNRRGNEAEVLANRKLIRPSLAELREQMAREQAAKPRPPLNAAPLPPSAAAAAPRPLRKPVPPDQTNAENFYYLKQMQSKTPMVIVLRDGEQLAGVIEWYDRHCIKLNRDGRPNLMIYKSNIKYLHKADESGSSQA